MKNLYNPCRLCPRSCGVDRTAGEAGFCKETAKLRAAAAVLHRGEEPPLVGKGGSGTIFVSGCNLGCVFCQNHQISQGEPGSSPLGKEVSIETFTGICLALQNSGAENINIVTGSHAVPVIVDGLIAAKKAGLQIPVLWNSSAYENTETLELLRDCVDIYLPDLKTMDGEIAADFFNAPDYPAAASAAILKMIDTGRGVIIRHLILPGYLDSTHSVLRWFADNASDSAQLSLMTQYTPIPNRGGTAPKRFITKEEYETVIGWLTEFGIEDGFCQEPVTGSEWLPDFRRTNPFPSELSVPVWHWASTSQI
ncbi:MAG: radical SAM protein [Treponema sp.]|jgi:putative pyruvate formate lyase activating enzyme|nr:radical SAM protein [Treponema sp.]